jgi:hypothetical protein
MGVNSIFVKQYFSKKIVEIIRLWADFRKNTVYNNIVMTNYKNKKIVNSPQK